MCVIWCRLSTNLSYRLIFSLCHPFFSHLALTPPQCMGLYLVFGYILLSFRIRNRNCGSKCCTTWFILTIFFAPFYRTSSPSPGLQQIKVVSFSETQMTCFELVHLKENEHTLHIAQLSEVWIKWVRFDGMEECEGGSKPSSAHLAGVNLLAKHVNDTLMFLFIISRECFMVS